MSVNLYLIPTQQPITIPKPCVQHIQNLLLTVDKNYKKIYQITLENVAEGIVGIYTDNEGRYYRVSQETVSRVNECYSRTIAASEEEKIAKINALVTEIIDAPHQFQLQAHLPIGLSLEEITNIFKRSTDEEVFTFGEVLVCHPRAPGSMFCVGVSYPNSSNN